MQVNEDKPYDDINITPMLDLAYVLLVIFIIMTTASVQGVKVELPHGSSTASLAVPKTIVISVSNSGQIFTNAIPVSIGELEQKLRDAMSVTPDLPIVLKGDRAVQYEKIMEVLDLCSRLGVKSIGLASQHIAGS
jgi:biopolymer transport protein ExbD